MCCDPALCDREGWAKHYDFKPVPTSYTCSTRYLSPSFVLVPSLRSPYFLNRPLCIINLKQADTKNTWERRGQHFATSDTCLSCQDNDLKITRHKHNKLHFCGQSSFGCWCCVTFFFTKRIMQNSQRINSTKYFWSHCFLLQKSESVVLLN